MSLLVCERSHLKSWHVWLAYFSKHLVIDGFLHSNLYSCWVRKSDRRKRTTYLGYFEKKEWLRMIPSLLLCTGCYSPMFCLFSFATHELFCFVQSMHMTNKKETASLVICGGSCTSYFDTYSYLFVHKVWQKRTLRDISFSL